MAVSRGDRFGFTQARVTTSKRLMARPALPRFVRAGDSFEAGVVVSKKAMGAGKVRVTAAFTGLTASVPLSRELEVPQDGSREVRFAVQAPHPGSATLRFDVEGGEERDSVLRSLTVALPMAPEATAIYGQTGGAQREMLGNLSAARADAGSLSVSLSSTALVGVDQTALDLIDYPYSCTEQLSSKILPLVGLGELGTALGFALPADARQRATAAVNEVLARQGGDGGFGMWPESSRSEEWVSAYATLALWRAARAGIVVPKHALDGARDYLRAVVQRMERDRPELLPAAALSLDVLGELGAPDPGSINRLYERRAELPSFGKALLLHAALSAKLASDVPKELRRDLEAKLHVDGARAVSEDDTAGKYAAIFASPARSQALVLRALAAGGKHPLLGGLVRGLLDARRQGKFRTTQESAWALLALDDYRRVAESEPAHFDASFSLGSAELGQASFAAASPLSRRFELPLGKLLERGGEPLRFEKQGSGTLFYEARLRYVRRELPRAPL
ncbi:MAG TPA: alpha-2-macroglobulin family protein, partial [Polyangiaceae bacterium]|nr:alpha-2-macroglobulin family protein [Polyangiaceae bacterium]